MTNNEVRAVHAAAKQYPQTGSRPHPLRTYYRQGFLDCLNGEPRSPNPIEDKRREGPKFAGRVTFARAFRNAWFDGWDAAKKEPDRGEE